MTQQKPATIRPEQGDDEARQSGIVIPHAALADRAECESMPSSGQA